MAYDDLPIPTPVIYNPPTPPSPPSTETRNILDINSNVIGTLTCPTGQSEDVWAALLALYSSQILTSLPGFMEFASSASTNTNSSSYVALNSMISGNLETGTYSVNFTANISTTAPLLSNPGFYISLFVNGIQVTTSEIYDASSSLSLFSISPIAMNINSIVNVGAGQKIEVRWKTNGVGNTITCTNRVLDIVRIH